MPRAVEGIRIGVVIKMGFETLNFSVICLNENVAIQNQTVASYFALKILSEPAENARKRRLNVVGIVLKK